MSDDFPAMPENQRLGIMGKEGRKELFEQRF
jgi:hypothetical protein